MRQIGERRQLPRLLALLVAIGSLACSPPDICAPVEDTVGFFSRGDCWFTRASFFQGHEWLSFLSNESVEGEFESSDSSVNDPDWGLISESGFDGDARSRGAVSSTVFSIKESKDISNGNRRVDWPLELMVHLDNGVLSYVNAMEEYTNQPEIQHYHFLLTSKNSSREAAAEGRARIVSLSQQAVGFWVSNRSRALALIGQAHHTIQDSYSEAHSVRIVHHGSYPWCIEQLKSFAPREAGAEPALFHGSTEDDSIGHTTTEDSIYRAGRDCHEPTDREVVIACLNDTAKRAILASHDYLQVISSLVRMNSPTSQVIADTVESYNRRHLMLCEELSE